MYDIDTTNWGLIFILLCSDKLPASTVTLWEQTLADKTSIPKWSHLNDFLYKRFRTLESVAENRISEAVNSRPVRSQNRPAVKVNTVRTFQTKIKTPNCPLCPSESHIIRKCPKFLSMNPRDRSAEIKKQRLCINCFSRSHLLPNCTSKFTCSQCSRKHHSLLYFDSNSSDSLNPDSAPFVSNSNIQSTTVQTCFSTSSQGVLLGTAMVQLCYLGLRYDVRALIDSGSEGTFISERLFNRLKLPFSTTNAKISGLNNSISATSCKQCSLLLGSSNDLAVQIPTSALVVSQLSGNLPSNIIPKDVIEALPEIPLADPLFTSALKLIFYLAAMVFHLL